MLPILRSRWILTGFGVASGGLMIWLFGPFLSVLDGVMPRALALVVLMTAWASINAGIDQMRRRTDRALARGVAASGAGAAEREEVAELRHRLEHAMTLLRNARGTRGYLYEQPWYVIIGPPGAGKTTALANAGLRFPLADELGNGEVRGVGGTRLCDWSFTDEAVLIDTAGRYTTQDSDAAADRAGWEGFLDLLRRTRAQQPLNGVIVAIGLDEVATAGEAERRAHARAIRSRVKELNNKLGVRLPIYAIFTKADLIAGFTEFFADMDRPTRAQVWGVTFPLDAGPAGPAGQFRGEFTSLVSQLSVRLVDRLQAERSLERRAAILAFPSQVASLEAPLAAFVEEAFGGTRLDPAPLLRGVYLASATQQGSAIDRLTSALAGDFGIDQRQMPAAIGRQGRGYFLGSLFKQMIFGEAMLVSRNPRAMRRQLLWRAAAWGCAAVFVVGSTAALAISTWQSQSAASRTQAALDKYDRAYQHLTAEQSLDPVPLAAADLLQILPLLDDARDAAQAAEADHAGLGLSQRAKLGQAAGQLYGRTLQYLLRPRLVSLMEARMRSHPNDVDYLYHAILPYRMLCCHLTMDPGALHAWLAQDLQADFAGVGLAAQRAALLAHADVLFSGNPALFPPMMDDVTPDTALRDTTMATVGHMSLGDRAYALIRAQPLPADVPDFDPERAAGGSIARRYFVRSDGLALDSPISGFFTRAGFQRVVLARLPAAIERAIRENPAANEDADIAANDPARRQQVERAVKKIYTDAYIAAWDTLLARLDIVPPRNSGAAIGDFSVLTSPTGPIARLLGAVVGQLSLLPAPPAQQPADIADTPADATLSGAAVDRHFDALRAYVAGGDLAAHLQALGRLEARIEDTVSSAAGGPPAPGTAAGREMSAIVEDDPEPAKRWLTALAARGDAVQSITQRTATADAFSGQGGAQALCRRVTSAFPFRAQTRNDASLEDFAALFSRDGTLDSFFAQYLRPYVSTGPGPWRIHPQGGLLPPIDSAAALSFQNAAMIRDAFFGMGGSSPQIRFAFRPVNFDVGTKKVTLDLDGVEVAFDPHGSGAIEPLEWPGPTGMTSARLIFDPPGDGPPLEESGPWALFRLLRSAQMQPTGSERVLRITFEQGERRAVLDLTTEGLRNPFRPSLLDHFSCPSLQQ
jgi:type VI secretion system protein ImpL